MIQATNLSKLFPFYLCFDQDGIITQEGSDWAYYGESILGRAMDDCFTFKQPKIKSLSYSSLKSFDSAIFLLIDKRSQLEYRFQLVCESDEYFFCGGLSLSSNHLWDENNIEFHRFSPHDVTGDYLVFKNTLEMLRLELKSSGDLVHKYQNEAYERKRSEHILTTLINSLPTPIAISKKNGEIFRSNLHFDNYFATLDNINNLRNHSTEFYHNEDGILHTIIQNENKSIHLKWSNSKDHVSGLQLWASSDITHLIQQQDELLIAYEKASESEKSKTRFFANMSHELRTPFNGILGVSELLLDSCTEPHHIDQLQIINTSCQSLLRIVNDILDLSKLDSDKLEYENASFDLKILVESVIELMGSYPHSERTKLTSSIDSNLPLFLKGDEHRIKQVLFNLISNGLKFTKEGHVSLSVQSHDQFVRYIVEDTGIGMSEGQLEAAFDSFSQASLEISRRYGGTGLGLNISRKMIVGMGGNISVRSQLGKGTQFVIDLPLVHGQVPPQVAQENQINPHWLQSKVLIVDDNSTNLKVLSLILKNVGVHCTEFLSGIDLIAYLQDNQAEASLIILDIQMPVLDGQEVFRIIRNNDLVHHSVPVIAVTANAFDEDIQSYLTAGFDQVLSKPISKKSVVSCLNDILRHPPCD